MDEPVAGSWAFERDGELGFAEAGALPEDARGRWIVVAAPDDPGVGPGADVALSEGALAEHGLAAFCIALRDAGARSLLLVDPAPRGREELALIDGSGVQRLALVGCAHVSGLDALARDRLTHLWIAGAPPSDATGLRVLAKWTHLRSLRLDAGLGTRALLRWIAGCRSLESLMLPRNERGETLGPQLGALARLERLERLALPAVAFDGRVWKLIAALPALREVDLSRSAWRSRARDPRTVRGVASLALRGSAATHPAQIRTILGNMPDLQRIDVRGSGLGARQLASLIDDYRRLTWIHDAPASQREDRGSTAQRPGPLRAGVEPASVTIDAPVTRSWPEQAPALRELYVAMDDDRGHPRWMVERSDLYRLAGGFDPRRLLDDVENAGLDDERRVVAMMLAPLLVARVEPRPGPVLDAWIAAVSTALEDGRVYGFAWDGGDPVRIPVEDLAAKLVVAGMSRRRRACGGRHPTADADDLARCERIVEHALERGRPGLGYVFAYLGEPALRWENTDPVVTGLDWIERAISDPKRPARLRLAALDRLVELRGRARIGDGDAMRRTWERTLAGLAAAIEDACEDTMFRRGARVRLARHAPARVEALRRRALVDTRPLPDPDGLVAGSVIDENAAAAAAVGVPADAVIGGLGSGEVSSTTAALALAPYVGTDDDTERIAFAVAELVGKAEHGMLAATRLRDLAERRPALDPSVWERAVRVGAAAPVRRRASAPAGLVWVAGWWGRHHVDGPEGMQKQVRAWFADDSASPTSRYHLALAFPRVLLDDRRNALLDPHEDWELRTLLGSVASGLLGDEFDTWADRTTMPWRARGPALPVCDPGDRVPREWLLETLRRSPHALPVRLALGSLVLRELGDDAAAEVLALLDELRILGLDRPRLAALLDDERFDFGHTAPAILLAAGGDLQDAGRLARFMGTRGAWFGQGAHERHRSPLDRLMDVREADSVADGVESELRPWLARGFAPAAVAHIEAQALAVLAARHLGADRVRLARRAARAALELDPANLDAHRLLREIGDGP